MYVDDLLVLNSVTRLGSAMFGELNAIVHSLSEAQTTAGVMVVTYKGTLPGFEASVAELRTGVRAMFAQEHVRAKEVFPLWTQLQDLAAQFEELKEGLRQYGVGALFPRLDQVTAHFEITDELFRRLLSPSTRSFNHSWPRVHLRFLRDQFCQVLLGLGNVLAKRTQEAESETDPRLRSAERLVSRLHRASVNLEVLTAEKTQFFEELADLVATTRELLAPFGPQLLLWIEIYSGDVEDLIRWHQSTKLTHEPIDSSNASVLGQLAQVKTSLESAVLEEPSTELLHILLALEMLGSHYLLFSCSSGSKRRLREVCQECCGFLLEELSIAGEAVLNATLNSSAAAAIEETLNALPGS